MLIQERIQIIIKANRLTPSEFADQIGIKRSNLSHVLSGRNKPSLDFLAKIINAFPKVNASWLVTGEAREEVQQEPAVKESPLSNIKEMSPVVKSDKSIEKIIVFYKDGLFDEYKPNA
jgi:transcriptional regulator with XRE-family HTH domain